MLTLRLDSQPGDRLKDVASAMCLTARRLEIAVVTTFHDVPLLACPGDEPEAVMAQFTAACTAEEMRQKFVAGVLEGATRIVAKGQA